jgi:hypothetical protein
MGEFGGKGGKERERCIHFSGPKAVKDGEPNPDRTLKSEPNPERTTPGSTRGATQIDRVFSSPGVC